MDPGQLQKSLRHQTITTLREEILVDGKSSITWWKLIEGIIKFKFFQEFNLADYQKIKYWWQFILVDRRNILPEVSPN